MNRMYIVVAWTAITGEPATALRRSFAIAADCTQTALEGVRAHIAKALPLHSIGGTSVTRMASGIDITEVLQ